MINKSQALEIINLGLSTGADYAEIFIEDKFSQSIVVENGKVETSSAARIFGAGIRLLKNLQSVYGYTNDVSKKSLTNLITSLSKSFNEKRVLTVKEMKVKKVRNRSVSEIPFSQVKDSEIISLLKSTDKIMHEHDKRIIRTTSSLNHYVDNVVLINSKGVMLKDSKERARMGLFCVASENGKIETAFEGPGASSGFEYFTKTIDVKALAKEAAERAILMLGAKECPSGKMAVIIGNAFGGVLFHEACGHSLEASSTSKNLSVFSNKIGQQIASPLVTAIDDGTIKNGWGSNNIDDEGNPTQKTVLIEKGILKNYLVDELNGRRFNQPANGASRRQSYRIEPTSRMSNTFICNGKSTPEEIIAATKLGLYAKSLGGGSVNPVTGEFNFSCSEAYLVRDGKICEPVRGASIIGTGQEILMNIDMVGNDLERAQGMCGASSGSIPVDVGQPTIRVSSITVGGNGGELK